MRTMCLTVVLIIFISDRRKGLASQAGFYPQREEGVEAHQTTQSPRERGVSDQYTAGIAEKLQRKTTGRKSEFLRESGTKYQLFTAKKEDGKASDSNPIKGEYKNLLKLLRKRSDKDNYALHSKSTGSVQSRNSHGQNAVRHGIETVPYVEMSTKNNPRRLEIRETGLKVQRRRYAERTTGRPEPRRIRRRRWSGEVLPIRGVAVTDNNGERSPVLVNSPTVWKAKQPSLENNNGNLLSQQTSVRKVALLILYTFPPGVLMGYWFVAIIFFWRNRRFLCCTECCETAMYKITCVRAPPRKSNMKSTLSLVTVSRRSSEYNNRRQTVPYEPSRDKSLEKQFEEDRGYFLKFGRDPSGDSSDVDQFVDIPSMPKKEWLERRLKWWIQKDRYRSLAGIFTDPNSPPDPPTGGGRLKSEISDFTSVSQTRGSSRNNRIQAAYREKAGVKRNVRKQEDPTETTMSESSFGESETSGEQSEFEA